MNEFLRSKSGLLAAYFVCSFYLLNLSFCWSLNDEGLALLRFKEKIVSDPQGALSNWIDEVGLESPCPWFGVECSEGHVVVLNLKDLHLGGSLTSDIGNLLHLKSIILRNNSFSGVIPEEIANLKELEVLDLGYNNFTGPIPWNLGNNFSRVVLLLGNNELLGSTRPEIHVLQKHSEVQVEDDLLSTHGHTSSYKGQVVSWNSGETRDVPGRKLLQEARSIKPSRPPPPGRNPPSSAPTPASSPSPDQPPSPSPDQPPSPSPDQPPSPSPSLSPVNRTHASPPSLLTPFERPSAEKSRVSHKFIVSAAIVGPALLLLLIGIIFCKSGKVATVKPWATGLSGQLQRALVTGVPKLKRSELEAACEDFSNVIGSLSVCTLYKGTLSSGVEIAVASIAVASAKDWSSSQEAQFRKKIETASKVNHKNFISLLGYCEEEEPFTRMLVFEYAPNGTLFEHLHIREAEHLDWATRLRIAMGMAYCLDHMHQLTPPLPHRNLTSSTIYLTEDYAAKVSDFVFWDKTET
ncbi:Non-specific serine/threonine protein kinase [Handroanthus impetiginosus]|uniref:Non-specific serine/threonine protein kinase n=1 Tax=Handroanthus impetiginosus TaxID=429701 RepID=A0A2G9HAR7_9LAMI|nr:Non-specific serine/threonine protein kinase [Handroanthus impetiginosus]